MSAAASSSAVKRRRKTDVQAPLPPPALALFSLPISSPARAGLLSLVPCPSCGIRTTIRLVSKSEANPGRIFYKCPKHHEDGLDNYFDFWARGGYVSHGLSSFDSAGGIASEETKVQEECPGAMQSTFETVVYADVVKKMNELIFLCKSILSALVVLIAIVVYVGFKK
ncbi:hypothetical protein VPH35_051685 [Triticum aestivum]